MLVAFFGIVETDEIIPNWFFQIFTNVPYITKQIERSPPDNPHCEVKVQVSMWAHTDNLSYRALQCSLSVCFDQQVKPAKVLVKAQ